MKMLMQLDLYKFRRLAITIFLTFPKLYTITVSEINDQYFIQMWKKDVDLKYTEGKWYNSEYGLKQTVGIYDRIPISFLGYSKIRCESNKEFIIQRQEVRLSSNFEINIKNMDDLRFLVDILSKYTIINKISIKNGKIILSNGFDNIILDKKYSGIKINNLNTIETSCQLLAIKK